MEWQVDVADIHGRVTKVTVAVRDGRVSVDPPPPTGGFSMTSDETDLLVVALLAASARASHRGLTGRE